MVRYKKPREFDIVFLIAAYLSIVLIFQDVNTAGESIAGLVQNSKRKLTNNLTCYQCHSEVHSECLNMTQYDEDEYEKLAVPCDVNETVCMVKRISFTTSTGNGPNNTLPMKTVSLKRLCATKCEPGCLIMGERTRLYFCSTCCTTSRCNVGSSGSLTTGNALQMLLILLLLVPLQSYCYGNIQRLCHATTK